MDFTFKPIPCWFEKNTSVFRNAECRILQHFKITDFIMQMYFEQRWRLKPYLQRNELFKQNVATINMFWTDRSNSVLRGLFNFHKCKPACFVVSGLFVLSSSLRSLSSLNSHKEYKLSVLRVFYTEAGYNRDWVSKFLIYSIKSPRLRGLSSWNYEFKVRR